MFGDHPYSVIVDDRGRYAWWYEQAAGDTSVRTRMSRDGRSVLFNHFAEDKSVDDSSIYRVSLDGTSVQEIRTEWGHHDFVELPEGGYAYLALDIRAYGERSIVGDSVIELDANGENPRTVWSAWDSWTPPDEPMSESFYPQGEDWLHANTLEYDAENDDYYVSIRNRSSVVRVDRESGELIYELGGDESDFTLTDGKAFEHQHSPLFKDGKLWVFDNRDGGSRSYVRSYTVDEEARTYANDWTYGGPEGNWVSILGDVDPVDDDNRLLGWGTAGFLSEIDTKDHENWRMDVEFGNGTAFGEQVDTLGGPWSE
jgi:hypothetical protein